MPPILAWLGSALLTFGSFVAVITVVVFFHELGHLLVGRWRGVKPEKFSIGFGPRLFGFMVGETEVRLSLLPFGGYVKFAGDNPLEEPKPEDKGRGFYQATPVSRGLIAVAGPVANFILAFVIFFAVFMAPQNSLAPIVGFVKPGSPAAAAGILPRDKIVAVDGLPVQGFFDVQEQIVKSPDRALSLRLERDGKPLDVSVTPISVDEKTVIETQKQGRIGISASPRAAVLALLDPESPAGKAGLKTFDRIEKLDGQPIGNYEELVARLANLLSQPAPATGNQMVAHQLEGTRPRAVDAPGATVWVQEPLALLLSIPSLGRTVSPAEVDALLGLACADLNLFVVQPGSAAEAAGLQRGDRMLSVDGKNVLWWSDEVETERLARGLEPMQVTVLRDGKKLDLTVKQFAKKQRDEAGIRVEVPELGAAPDYRIQSGEPQWIKIHYSFLQALAHAGKETIGATRLIALGLAGMVSGKISTDALGGPLMIADVARKAAGYGLMTLAALTANISVNLGLMNLIPLPVLDGFHVFSAILERIRRRPLPIKVIEIANLVGIAMLLVLMAFAFRNDLARKFFE